MNELKRERIDDEPRYNEAPARRPVLEGYLVKQQIKDAMKRQHVTVEDWRHETPYEPHMLQEMLESGRPLAPDVEQKMALLLGISLNYDPEGDWTMDEL